MCSDGDGDAGVGDGGRQGRRPSWVVAGWHATRAGGYSLVLYKFRGFYFLQFTTDSMVGFEPRQKCP